MVLSVDHARICGCGLSLFSLLNLVFHLDHWKSPWPFICCLKSVPLSLTRYVWTSSPSPGLPSWASLPPWASLPSRTTTTIHPASSSRTTATIHPASSSRTTTTIYPASSSRTTATIHPASSSRSGSILSSRGGWTTCSNDG